MSYFENYFAVIVFIGVAVGIGMAMLMGSYIISPKAPDAEKNSTYECGFDPFSDTLSKFHVHFYLVSMLFILFDLEIVYLFPWAVVFESLSDFGFYSMMFFLFVLTVGFAYEWRKGALEWS